MEYRKRDTLSPQEQALFERYPSDKSEALRAQLADWFDSRDSIHPMMDAILSALDLEPYRERDQQMRLMLTVARQSNVWEPRRILAHMVWLADEVKPPVLPPLINREE